MVRTLYQIKRIYRRNSIRIERGKATTSLRSSILACRAQFGARAKTSTKQGVVAPQLPASSIFLRKKFTLNPFNVIFKELNIKLNKILPNENVSMKKKAISISRTFRIIDMLLVLFDFFDFFIPLPFNKYE